MYYMYFFQLIVYNDSILTVTRRLGAKADDVTYKVVF